MTTQKEPFIPLSVPNFRGREMELVTEAVRTEWVSTGGPFISEFENKIAAYVGARSAVACQSGTAGLHIALLLAGVKPGDEVIAPALTFIAPINTINYVGASPVFMDCDDFLCMDVEKVDSFLKTKCQRHPDGSLRNRTSGKRIAAVLPVHVFGNTVDMVKLGALCEQYDLPIVEDATESLGSFWTEGPLKNKYSGTVSLFGVYSFNGNKIITTGGGGMLVTHNEALAKKAKYLTNQSKDDDVAYIHNEVGYNYRMTNMQAALGIAQLEQLEQFIATKNANFALYERLLQPLAGSARLLPFRNDLRANKWFYACYLENSSKESREEVTNKLQARQIQTRPIWYLNHKQRPFAHCESYAIERAEHYWGRVINLPCSTNMTPSEVERVAATLAEVLQR